MSLLAVHNLGFRYAGAKEPALQDVSLQLASGEYVLVRGSGGSGKSSLCRALTGLIPQHYAGEFCGEVLIDGLNALTHEPGQLFGRLAAVFANPAQQFFCGTVEDEIAYGLESLGADPTAITAHIATVARRVQITALLSRHPHDLSGGEQQLVLLAVMLAIDAPLLILDEPFAHLDNDAAARLDTELAAAAAQGKAVLVCEHRIDRVVPRADRVITMHQGRVVQDAPADQSCAYSNEISDCETEARSMSSYAAEGKDCVVCLNRLCISVDGRPVIHNLSLQLQRGDSLAILGPNGVGKTTLVSHLIGIIRAESGNSWVCGHDPQRAGVAVMARDVGFSFQNPDAQLSAITVREEIEIGPRALKCLDRDWINELIALLGLRELEYSMPFRLSGGQRRRVATAAAAAAQPKLLILDEPTAGLDPDSCQRVVRLIRRMRAKGTTVIVVTHDSLFASASADRTLQLTPAGRLHPARHTVTAAPQSSFDPRAGLAVALAVTVAILVLPRGLPTLVVYLLVVVATVVLRYLGRYLRWLRMILPIAAAWVVIAGLTSSWPVGVSAGLRLLSMSSVFFLFFQANSPEEIADALQSAGVSHRAGFVLRGGLQFVPVLQGLIHDVITAQKARGLRPRRTPTAFLVPLLLQSFTCSDRLAEAMELRGFARRGRTQLRRRSLRHRDWSLIGGSFIVAFGIVAIVLLKTLD